MTLMIWGDHDPVVPVADARKVADLIPTPTSRCSRQDTCPQLGNSERVGSLLEDFTRSAASRE